MTRPSGLTYVKHKENPTSIRPGQHLSPSTQFQPGQVAWNKGVPSGIVPETAFKPGAKPWNKGTSGLMPAGAAHPNWSGDGVGYGGLHIRVRKVRGTPDSYSCRHADDTCKGPMDWANISGKYRGVDDFVPLCRSHHIRFDRRKRQLVLYLSHRQGQG